MVACKHIFMLAFNASQLTEIWDCFQEGLDGN